MFLDGEIFRKTEKFPRARGRAHGEGRTPFGSRRPDPHEGDKGMGGVGLSMMCYRLREANKTCLGERQERGRMGKLL